jgi:hypothetical protein
MDKQLHTSGSSAPGSGLYALAILLANLNYHGIYDCLIQVTISGILGGGLWIATQAVNEYRKERKEHKRILKERNARNLSK